MEIEEVLKLLKQYKKGNPYVHLDIYSDGSGHIYDVNGKILAMYTNVEGLLTELNRANTEMELVQKAVREACERMGIDFNKFGISITRKESGK